MRIGRWRGPAPSVFGFQLADVDDVADESQSVT